MIAGVRITVPWGDRNLGNRAAASAERRRQQDLLEATRAEVLADYHAALDDYQLRRAQITDIVVPLREHAASLAQIAQAAYAQGGTDLLRLLDARRAQLDADLAWVHAMADWQQSAAAVAFAGGRIK
jgi:outer membrane protein TolC